MDLGGTSAHHLISRIVFMNADVIFVLAVII